MEIHYPEEIKTTLDPYYRVVDNIATDIITFYEDPVFILKNGKLVENDSGEGISFSKKELLLELFGNFAYHRPDKEKFEKYLAYFEKYSEEDFMALYPAAVMLAALDGNCFTSSDIENNLCVQYIPDVLALLPSRKDENEKIHTDWWIEHFEHFSDVGKIKKAASEHDDIKELWKNLQILMKLKGY